MLQGLIEEFRLYGYQMRKDFSMDEAIGWMRQAIQVKSNSPTTFTLSYSASDARLAQAVTKRLAEVLIQSNSSRRKTRVIETDQFLDDQLRQAENDLATQEEKIKQFKTQHLGELPEQSAANLNVLNGLSAQLSAAENALQHARDQQRVLELRQQEQKRLRLLSNSLDSVRNQAATQPDAQEALRRSS